MAWKLTVGGVDKTADIRKESLVRVSFTVNNRSTASFVCQPGYIPARLAEVLVYDTDGTTAIWGGLVMTRAASGLVFGAAPVLLAVECAGFETYLDWCYLSLNYTSATTLGTVLTAIQAALPAGYGVTLDTGMGALADALGAFAWVNMRASDAMRELSDRTGKVWSVSAAKKLRMVAPGGSATPLSLTDGAVNCRELTWRDTDQPPANTVLLACGPSGTDMTTQVWVCNGSDTSWVAPIASAQPGEWGVVMVTPYGQASYAATVGVVGSGAEFEWNAATSTLAKGTHATPANLTTLSFAYLAQFPFVVEATSGASPEVQTLVTLPDVLSYATAQEIATEALARVNQSAIELDVTTLNRGSGLWAPGQAVTVNLTARGLNAAYNITDVTIELVTGDFWRWTLRATSGTKPLSSYLDGWRRIQNPSTGTAAFGNGGTGGSPTAAGLTPAYLGGSRNTAIQAATYQPVSNCVPFIPLAASTGTVRVWLFALRAGVGCTARLRNTTDGTTAGTSAKVTSTAAQAGSFAATLVAGKTYQLELLSDTAGEPVYGVGTLQP